MAGTQVAALVLCGLYGLLTAITGLTRLASRKTPMDRSVGLRTVTNGLLLIAAAIAVAADPGTTAFLLIVVALLSAHVMAINNGLALFGKINPSHHIGRLVLSLLIGVLAYLAT